jgi:hypothetical protein
MAQVLVDQLTEIMPELADVSPWHAVGQRRARTDVGKAAARCIRTLMRRGPPAE